MPAIVTGEADEWYGGELPQEILEAQSQKLLDNIKSGVHLALHSLFNREVAHNVKGAFEAFAAEGAWSFYSCPAAIEWELSESDLWGGDELPVRLILTPGEIVKAGAAYVYGSSENAEGLLEILAAFRAALDEAEAHAREALVQSD